MAATKKWEQAEIEKLLTKSDEMVRRSVLKLYEYQTAGEQRVNYTMYFNRVGFNRPDSFYLSDIARLLKYGNKLTDKQIWKARKTIMKYTKQLTKIANGELQTA